MNVAMLKEKPLSLTPPLFPLIRRNYAVTIFAVSVETEYLGHGQCDEIWRFF